MNLKINLTDEEAAFLKQYAEVYEDRRKARSFRCGMDSLLFSLNNL